MLFVRDFQILKIFEVFNNFEIRFSNDWCSWRKWNIGIFENFRVNRLGFERSMYDIKKVKYKFKVWKLLLELSVTFNLNSIILIIELW